MPRGKLVVIEGPEGSGKSTAIEALKVLLPPDKFFFTREPGGTDFAEVIGRRFLQERAQPVDSFEQVLCVEAARSHHVRHVILPGVKLGKNCICDRFSGSTFAYQVHESSPDIIKNLFPILERQSTHSVIPDLWILLDVEPEVGLARLGKRGGKTSIFDDGDLTFHEQIRCGLKIYLEHRPKVSIDTTLLTKDEVVEQVRQAVLAVCDLY